MAAVQSVMRRRLPAYPNPTISAIVSNRWAKLLRPRGGDSASVPRDFPLEITARQLVYISRRMRPDATMPSAIEPHVAQCALPERKLCMQGDVSLRALPFSIKDVLALDESKLVVNKLQPSSFEYCLSVPPGTPSELGSDSSEKWRNVLALSKIDLFLSGGDGSDSSMMSIPEREARRGRLSGWIAFSQACSLLHRARWAAENSSRGPEAWGFIGADVRRATEWIKIAQRAEDYTLSTVGIGHSSTALEDVNPAPLSSWLVIAKALDGVLTGHLERVEEPSRIPPGLNQAIADLNQPSVRNIA